MQGKLSRREALIAGGITLAGIAAESSEGKTMRKEPFGYCLNTSTIGGQKHKVPLVEEIAITAKAGYTAIEPWISELEAYGQGGGKLKELGARIKDAGLSVEDCIGFFEWIVDDDGRRKKALEQARRDMDKAAQIGSKRLAAPAVGATDRTDMDYRKAAERYRALCDLGDQFGIEPMVEVWGFSKTLQRLGEASFVAIESGHPKAQVLADVYHLYKGGSPITGLKLLSKNALHVIHMNDYPAMAREKINDSDRVYPGDGIAPLDEFFHILRDIGFSGYLSVELFNESYYQQDPLVVAKTALKKTQDAAKKALG